MKIYETTLVFRRDLTPQQVEDLAKKYEKLLTDKSGKLHKIENWGLVPLAYPIKKNTKAYYVMLETETSTESLNETHRLLGLDESVLRFLSVKLETPSDKPSPMMKRLKEQGVRKHA
ncbi:MAG: 30S ribosomal protein S6 [Alphaproteobacteria bacterium]|nr:30S ribosomal protein S6 [Alphaproteobacteria bacterium]MBN2779916.1 30S ribosomal protein S6 [Alphaproteobacteria bacterium]